jgi:hypothetical protein
MCGSLAFCIFMAHLTAGFADVEISHVDLHISLLSHPSSAWFSWFSVSRER